MDSRTDRTDPPTAPRTPDEERLATAERLCQQLADGVASWPPNSKRPKVSEAWVAEMDRLVRIDRRPPDEVSSLVAWLFAADHKQARFWAGNVRCPDKLRLQYDRIRANRDEAVGDAKARTSGQQPSDIHDIRTAFETARSIYLKTGHPEPSQRWAKALAAITEAFPGNPKALRAATETGPKLGSNDEKVGWFTFRDHWLASTEAMAS